MPIVNNIAVAAAATQLRIIDLDQVLDGNISNSMNFAIDFSNQTFRMTGLQFLDYLNLALAIDGTNVSYDDTVFQSFFPLDPTPPDDIQDAIDFGLPILANAEAGNIGKSLTPSFEVINFNVAGFFSLTGAISAYINAVSTSPNFSFSIGINFTQNLSLNYITKVNGVEVKYNIFASDTRTSGEANTILGNADTGNIGKVTPPSLTVDLNLMVAAGFYDVNGTLNFPQSVSAGALIVISRGATGALTQELTNTGQNKKYTRSLSGGVWSDWQKITTDNAIPVSTDTLFGGFKHTVVGNTLNLFTT